jgi:hypothetical protein
VVSTTRVSVLFWAAALSVAVLSYCLLSLSHAPSAEAAYPCSGKDVFPAQNLTMVAASSPAGTTFCIHDGTYNVSKQVVVQDNDRFIGLYDDSSRPAVVTTQALHVFNVSGASGALIKGLKVSGAVGGNYCEPNCGRGIGGSGRNLTVDDVWATNNKNQGIGGTGPGLLVRNSLIDHNGSRSFGDDGGPVSAAGVKSVNSFSIINSTIRDNYWKGVWCDIDCNAFEVRDSTIAGNGKAGIHYEISTGPAIIEGNLIQGNGYHPKAATPAGILVVGSRNLNAYNNTFGSNLKHGIVVSKHFPKKRKKIYLHDNTMNGDPLRGCRLRGVRCEDNR